MKFWDNGSMDALKTLSFTLLFSLSFSIFLLGCDSTEYVQSTGAGGTTGLESISTTNGLGSNAINDIFIDHNEVIYAATGDGLSISY